MKTVTEIEHCKTSKVTLAEEVQRKRIYFEVTKLLEIQRYHNLEEVKLDIEKKVKEAEKYQYDEERYMRVSFTS